MNKITNVLTSMVVAFMAILSSACSDELFLRNELGSRLTEQGDYRVSRFRLEREVLNIPTTEENIIITLVSHSDDSEMQFDATVEFFPNYIWVAMLIPRSHKIADSDYDLFVTLSNGKRLGTKLAVTFRDEMLHQVSSRAHAYDLSGKGTLDKPYLISSADDFLDFQIGLAEDTLRGAGLYFKQTANLTAPKASDAINGRLTARYDFAGIYDGGNNAINLQYSGSATAEADDNVGLFATLLDGASIKDLTINASIRGGKSCVGALAGTATGNVVLDNVTAKGYVIGVDDVGSIIGKVNGSLSASGCHLAASVSGESNVGGLVGHVDGGTITVNSFSNFLTATPEEIAAGSDIIQMHDFAIIASKSRAGGVAGLVNGGINISDVILQHTIDSETTNIKVVDASNYAGGLVGEANITSASTVSGIRSLAPVSASYIHCGGLFGKLHPTAEVSILSVTIGTQVYGKYFVGGFAGYADNGSMITIGKASNGSNCILGQVRNGFVEIKGQEDVGGIFGYLEGDIHATSTTELNINVTGSGSNTGGVVGRIYNGTLECQYFSIDDNMTITGHAGVGGIVGSADHSTIRSNLNGNKSINAKSHPSQSSFSSTICGKVRPYDSSSGNIGGIIGHAYDTYISALCFMGSVDGYYNVGGIVGCLENYTRGYIYDCVNNGSSVTGTSCEYIGGIIGLQKFLCGNQSDLINYAKVQGEKNVGGIVGAIIIENHSPNFDISNIFNEGDISGANNVGGCIGYIGHADVDDVVKDVCVNYAGNFGPVSSSGTGNVGGILGHGNSTKFKVQHCANHGAVSSSSEAKVGGIAGRMGLDAEGVRLDISDNMELAYCCNRGEISSKSTLSHVGGLLGYQEEGHPHDLTEYMTHDCYNAGKVSSDQNDDNGGIVGFIDCYGEIRQCINFGEVSYGNGIVGTHAAAGILYHHDNYTLENMGKDWCATVFSSNDKTKESTFEGLDFNKVWRINDSNNDGFPSLRDCPFQFK